MCYTNMCSNIKVYQKDLVMPIQVGCATRSLCVSSGPKAEGVPTKIRGNGDQDPVDYEEV